MLYHVAEKTTLGHSKKKIKDSQSTHDSEKNKDADTIYTPCHHPPGLRGITPADLRTEVGPLVDRVLPDEAFADDNAFLATGLVRGIPHAGISDAGGMLKGAPGDMFEDEEEDIMFGGA